MLKITNRQVFETASGITFFCYLVNSIWHIITLQRLFIPAYKNSDLKFRNTLVLFLKECRKRDSSKLLHFYGALTIQIWTYELSKQFPVRNKIVRLQLSKAIDVYKMLHLPRTIIVYYKSILITEYIVIKVYYSICDDTREKSGYAWSLKFHIATFFVIPENITTGPIWGSVVQSSISFKEKSSQK